MIGVAALAGLAMLGRDALTAASVILLVRRRPYIAGVLDGLADIAAVLSIGDGAFTVQRHGASWTTAAVLGSIWLGSVIGTRIGAFVDRDAPVEVALA